MIKLSDFTDNGVGITYTLGTGVARRARKHAAALPVCRELLDRDDTPLTAQIKDHIRGQLALADQRFTTILAA